MTYKKWTKPRPKEFLDNLVNEYLTTGITMTALSKKYNTDAGYQLKKLGIQCKPYLETDKKGITLNYMFETPKNEVEAYILGIMFADGYVSSKNQIGLRLKSTDKKTLDDIRKYFSPEIKLQEDKSKKCNAIVISSWRAVENAKSIGLIERKTGKDLRMPCMDKSLIRHFIRGYFDGDGTIHVCNFNGKPDRLKSNIYCVTTSILEDMQKHMKEYNIDSKINKEVRKGRVMRVPQGGVAKCNFDMYRLFIRTKESLSLFYDYLYKDATIYLDRKKKVFDDNFYLLEYKRKPRAN